VRTDSLSQTHRPDLKLVSCVYISQMFALQGLIDCTHVLWKDSDFIGALARGIGKPFLGLRVIGCGGYHVVIRSASVFSGCESCDYMNVS
jgi:hypothetical protein